MAKASINFATAKGGGESEKHMDRDPDHKVTYLLDHDSKNNEYKTYRSASDYLEKAKVAAKEITGRKMQQKAIDNFVQEAVVNLNENHTVDDVKKVFDEFQKEFGGFEVFKIAVHRDEGVFVDTEHDIKDLEYDSKTLTWIKNGLDVTNEVYDYAPNRNIFYNAEDKNWYLDKKFTEQIDTSRLQIKMNYHAHVQFTKFDMSQGRNARSPETKNGKRSHGLTKSDLSRIQDINAQILGMQRGEKFTKTKRMNHYQVKQAHDSKREIKKQVKAKKKDIDKLKDEIRAEMIAEGGHTPDEYKALNDKFKALQKQRKNDELTIKDLKEKVNRWKHEAMNWREAKSYKELYDDIRNENLDLKKQNKTLQSKISVNTTDETVKDVQNDSSLVSELVTHSSTLLKESVHHTRETDQLLNEPKSNEIMAELYNERGREKIVKRGGKYGIGADKVEVVEIDKVDFVEAMAKMKERENNMKALLGKSKYLVDQFRESLLKAKDYLKTLFQKQDHKKNLEASKSNNKDRGIKR